MWEGVIGIRVRRDKISTYTCFCTFWWNFEEEVIEVFWSVFAKEKH